MSFILDALKKSENERQRTIGPSLADVPMSRRRQDKPWWVVAVAALLVINLGVLLVVLMRDGDAKPAAAAPAQAAPAPVAATPAPRQQVGTQQYAGVQIPVSSGEDPPMRSVPPATQPSPAVRSLADEASGYGATVDPQNPQIAGAAAVPSGPPMVRPIDAPAVAPAQPVFESRQAQGAGARNEILPTIEDLSARGTRIPELHLDIHVSSANAAERFVFVNMRKYVEGQTLNEGPVVERITADGVILNQHGLRFLLPRQ